MDVTGTPELDLTVGSTSRAAQYVAGDGTDTLVFHHIVQAGDLDSDGIVMSNTISLSGGTLEDSVGNAADLDFTLPNLTNVRVDAVGPFITAVTKPADAWYVEADTLTFRVTFTENVDVAGGPPRLELTVGATTRYANYVSGDGTDVLVFDYVVPGGDADTDGIVMSSPLQLNTGTIDDGVNPATLTLTPPSMTNVRVDTSLPNLTVLAPPSDATYIEGETLRFTATWNENVYVSGTPRIVLGIGASTRYANYVSGDASTNFIFEYVVSSGDNDADGITIAQNIDLNSGGIDDIAGNNADLDTATTTLSGVLVDTTVPNITAVLAPANDTYIETENLDFTVSFSEAVNRSGNPQLLVVVGTSTYPANYQAGDGTDTWTFRYTVGSGHTDTDGIAVLTPLDLNGGSIQDGGGNVTTLALTPPATGSIFVDTTAPTIPLVEGPLSGTYVAGETLAFTVSFSENVVVSGTPQLNLNIGGTPRDAAYQSGSGTDEWTFEHIVQVGDMDTDGITITALVDLNGGGIFDVGGNASAIAFTPPDLSTCECGHCWTTDNHCFGSGIWTVCGHQQPDLHSDL